MSKKKIKDIEINKKNMIIKKLNHYALIENKINNILMTPINSKKQVFFNNKIRLKHIKNIYCLLCNFIFILFTNLILTGKVINKMRNLHGINIISLKVKGPNRNILFNSKTNPDLVLVNGNQTENDLYYIIDNNKTHNITLIWNDSLETFERLFYYQNNIIEIDLSKFDSSNIKSMQDMFYYCPNLKYINFGNINTSSVVDMSEMFAYCTSLTSMDISNFDTSKVTKMDYFQLL